MGCPELQCRYDDSVVFLGDPDIAGPGVLLSFQVSAWLSFAFALITYLFIEDGMSADNFNQLDILLVKNFHKLRDRGRGLLTNGDGAPGRPISRKALQQIAIMLSDQQLITSAAIIIIAFWRHCVITQYHFYIAVLLAWTASGTLQSTTMIAQPAYLKNIVMRYTRGIAMLAQLIFALVAVWFVNNNNFLLQYGFPTQCLFDNMGSYTGQNLFFAVVSTVVLVWSLVAITALQFPGVYGYLDWMITGPRWFLERPSRIYQHVRLRSEEANKKVSELKKMWREPEDGQPWQLPETLWNEPENGAVNPTVNPQGGNTLIRAKLVQLIWQMISMATFFLFLSSFIVSEIIDSKAFHFFRVYAILIWGTLELKKTKRAAPDNGLVSLSSTYVTANTTLDPNSIPSGEDEWGFGQILPMFLLILPVLATMEIVYGNGSYFTRTLYKFALIRFRGVIKAKKDETEETTEVDNESVESESGSTERSTGHEPPERAGTSTSVDDFGLPKLRLRHADTEEQVGFAKDSRDPISIMPRRRFRKIKRKQQEGEPQYRLEDLMYQKLWFQGLVSVLTASLFGGLTFAAIKGYAF